MQVAGNGAESWQTVSKSSRFVGGGASSLESLSVVKPVVRTSVDPEPTPLHGFPITRCVAEGPRGDGLALKGEQQHLSW